jgi:hypothetical protein
MVSAAGKDFEMSFDKHHLQKALSAYLYCRCVFWALEAKQKAGI